MEKLAATVDGKIVGCRSAWTDGRYSLRVAVLAALNIADELARLTERYEAVTATGKVSRRCAAAHCHFAGRSAGRREQSELSQPVLSPSGTPNAAFSY